MDAPNQFTGPRAKLRAVRRHGNTFKAELDRYKESNKDALKSELCAPSAERVFYAELRPVPEDLSVIAGEIAYQLRSSLDVLACDLALQSGAADSKGVYFPISRTESGFREKGTQDKIKKLAPEFHTIIEEIRPYGDSILVSLNELANTDKHRSLVGAIPSIKDVEWSGHGRGEIPENITWRPRQPGPLETGRIELLRLPLDSPIEAVHIKLNCHVIFTVKPIVGEPVSHWFTQAARTVEGIIARFEDHCFRTGRRN